MTVGVLLVNLGTPDDPSPKAVRRYLAEFLSDRRVVEIPPVVWQPILRGIVLTTRPKKSAHAYAQVWQEDSPLRAITRAQAEALQGEFGPDVKVEWAMRYGNPSMAARLKALDGCERLLVAPLYPQYCAATTASVTDRLFDLVKARRSQPALRTLPPYYSDPLYIEALTHSIALSVSALDFEPQLIVASFHGMPERTAALGDPYLDQCLETARLLAGRIDLPLRATFQSRFGRAAWLRPYTDATLAALPGEGIKRVAVVAPGFSADCVETLEEIAIRGRDSFERGGGERFAYLPCLNATDDGIALLKKLLSRELAGWASRP